MQCSTVAVLYQKTSSKGKIYTAVKNRKLLQGTTYGELAANFVTPEGWFPVDELVCCFLSFIVTSCSFTFEDKALA